MLLKFNRKNVGPMEDKELVFAPHVNVFTGDNSLGKSFLLDLLWFGLTRVWPADLNRRLSQGFPARPRDIWAKDAMLEYVFRPAGKVKTNKATFSYDKERAQWKARRGKKHKAGLVIYAMADGSYAVWEPIQNYSSDEHDKKEFEAFVLSPSELWPPAPKWDGSTMTVEKSSFCNGVLQDWARWQGNPKNGYLFDLLKMAMKGLVPDGDIVDFPELEDVGTTDGDEQPVLQLKYGRVLLKHASSSIRRMASLAYVLVWAVSQHVKTAKSRGLPITDQIIILADEIETHLHPRWQRSVMDGLLKTVKALCTEEKFDNPDVQMFISTHSPLVMAALEDVFCGDQPELPLPKVDENAPNRWFDLDIAPESGGVKIENRPFQQKGSAESWLKSNAFDLPDTHSCQVSEWIRKANEILEVYDGDESVPAEKARELDELCRNLSLRRLNDIDDTVYRIDRLARKYRGGAHGQG
ncbi:MAG: ATP-binding protein [Kiritimatiellae bacterium]|nr:ATP-binding protein [Kiritimatiellia bacterium]